MKVSVLIPTHNRRQYVVDAIMEEIYALGDDPRRQGSGPSCSP